jgi:hypothetical protein
MALGELAKQLAGQAIGNPAKEVMDALRPGEAAGQHGAAAESPGAVILGQLQAMQKALREDQELAVYVQSGTEMVRVYECFLPSGQVIVLSGTDREKNITRVVAPAGGVQLTCKVLKVQAGAKAARVAFKAPRQKPE